MSANEEPVTESKKQCFVVMGFGIKTDLATGRKLNLDKSYQALIKPTIESKGITCMRADEIKHSGTIDVPMFQQLLTADIVVADLSTSNVNAFYELGVRHALRPRTTIIMSEEQLSYPFDINHITINKYTHLGDSIDYFEVLRFQKVLGDTVDAVLNDTQPDSPVYTFLDGLIPPALKENAENVAKQVSEALNKNQSTDDHAPIEDNPTLSLIVKQAEATLKTNQFAVAKGLFMTALLASNCDLTQKIVSNNTYLVQRLAYATYKAKLPDEVAALNEALNLLNKIDLDHTNDSTTVSLAGAIEKRLFQQGLGEAHLDASILYYQRGYFLLHSRYNGINLAFLLTCRVDTSLDPKTEDKIADMVWANRIRRDVLAMCEKDWNLIASRPAQSSTEINQNPAIVKTQDDSEAEQKVWILLNKAEACLGLGDMKAYEEAKQQAFAISHEDNMINTFTSQESILESIMRNNANLLSEPWNSNIKEVLNHS